jgi:exosortase E/protease (VPEID-CTERM system)
MIDAGTSSAVAGQAPGAGMAARLPNHGWRLAAVAVLALAEVFLTSLLFDFRTGLPEWSNPVAYLKKSAHVGMLAGVALLIVLWPSRERIVQMWGEAVLTHRWLQSLLVNLALAASLLAATVAFSSLSSSFTTPPLHWLAAYGTLLLATAASLALLAAPLSFWRGLLRTVPIEIVLAILSAIFVVLAMEVSKEGWAPLSAATLAVSRWMLGLYENNVVVDLDRALLGVGDFHVLILRECSGYEGIGLVLTILSLYMWIFRRSLCFPHAFLLLPIGAVAVWLLNSVRIAALISIGAHFSPAVALGGFHSQGGWIGFLLVTVGIMAASQRAAFFSKGVAAIRPAPARADERLLLALLAPFMALMAASIIASAFAPNDQWLYALKVAGMAAALWWFRDQYAAMLERVSVFAVLTGLAVGVLWIATDPARDQPAALGLWLATLPAPLFLAWITIRALGSVVLVPIAEELAFRGYLHRVLISRHFERVSPGQFSWLALIVSSVLFGILHQRWLAAALAGAVYALLMYRSNRLSDPIAAHMASNAIIVAWAVAAGQWSLL